MKSELHAVNEKWQRGFFLYFRTYEPSDEHLIKENVKSQIFGIHLPAGMVFEAERSAINDYWDEDINRRKVVINIEITGDKILEYLRDTRVTLTSQIGSVGKIEFAFLKYQKTAICFVSLMGQSQFS